MTESKWTAEIANELSTAIIRWRDNGSIIPSQLCLAALAEIERLENKHTELREDNHDNDENLEFLDRKMHELAAELSTERERAKAWREAAEALLVSNGCYTRTPEYQAALALEAAHKAPKPTSPERTAELLGGELTPCNPSFDAMTIITGNPRITPRERVERGPERRIAKSDGYYGPFRRAQTTGTDRRCWTQEDFDKAAIRKAELEKLFVDTEEIDRRKEQP